MACFLKSIAFTIVVMLKKTKKPSIPPFGNLIIIILVVIFIGIRLVHLPESIGFGSDEGRDFLTAWNIYTNKQLKLIGPPSEFTVNGREFYFGPAPYYVILPILVVGNWDP